MGDPDVWPVLLDMSRDDCKRILRRLELEAYSNLVSVLRAQGSLTTQKRRLLQTVAQTLGISEERHKAECRRAVNSEKLATIAKHMGGANSGTEWAIEGRRLVPLLPRLVPQTAFTAIADKVANMAMTEGAKLPLPTPPVKKRLSSPPIDETLLEPNVPEASKTSQVSSGTPLLLSLPSVEISQHPQPEKTFSLSAADRTPPSQVSPLASIHSQGPVANSLNLIPQAQVKQEEELAPQDSQDSSFPAISSNNIQPSSQTLQHHTAQKSQFVLLVKKEDRLKDERLSRKRPRSASLDVPLNIPPQGSMLPPPVKKEATSPPSPVGTPSPLAQLPATISPQSHSQLVQQQTLQAAAAAAAAASPPPSQPLVPTHAPQVQLQCQPSPPPPPPPLPSQLSQAAPVVPQPQQHVPNLPASTPSTNPAGRTITIPSQGAVKLSLSSATSSSGSGIPSGTHKVIIVSSTTPSILQRSLSVPVVKSLSTCAPSQPCSSTLVLNTAQQNQQSSSNATTANSDIITTTSSQQVVSTTLSSKVQGKLLSQPAPKARPRANSIVIPVTPNQANVMNSVGVTSVQLKSALQSGKAGVLKAGDTTGLKIMPLPNVSGNSKLVQKAPGTGPMYVVSTSTASPTVSMVARTVPSGQRVMTFTSSGPRVAATQASNILSKPVQTLQLTQASSGMTSSGTIPLSSTSGKPNVIVVQKGSTAFGRGVTISHGGKEVVGKVLLGGKALTSLNQSPASPNSSALSPALSQAIPSQTSQTFAQPQQTQVSLPTTSTSTRVVTVQKLPSAVVQGSTGSVGVIAGNVIVLDLSQEQFNNSAVLNEILASSILQSSNVVNYNHEASNASINSLRGLINFPSEQSETESGVLSKEDNNILVEGFDQIMGRTDSNIATVGSNTSSDFSVEMSENPETPESFVMDSSSFYHGGQTSNNTSTQPSRVHTDICATAMSNANLNLNDFLDDSSLDDIQPISLEAMKMELATEMTSDPENNGTCGNTDENVGDADN
ncbi:hypothetical protein ONE63_010686 [Megalurothrips usitatus]|uniref:ENT domain-containing protein n=1 Tax=Megalurothrips usitatus TaxID=439358 RepID=A0AAV7XER7_9NEOP|nr:hypothetical protein ONE63_010686 [Megalurothrips usitatus]